MTEKRRPFGRWLACAGLIAIAACGKSDGKNDDIAKAFSGPPTTNEVDASKGMADLKAKAEAKAQKAKADELERVTVAPAEVPDLAAACTEAGAAFDEYKQKRIVAEELGRWNATKEPDIRKVVDACKETANPRVAACEASGLRGASVAHFGPDGADEIIDHCKKRWGEAAQPG